MNKKYGFGHIVLPWDKQHRELSYVNRPFNDPDLAAAWKEWGYTNITGDMYDAREPAPEWFDINYFNKEFNWEHLQWCFYKMGKNTVLPEHIDKYTRYKELFKSNGKLYRAVVFLEDWQPGHCLTIADKQMPQWVAGQYAWWEEDVIHSAANVGIHDRYTLQLTGYKIEST